MNTHHDDDIHHVSHNLESIWKFNVNILLRVELLDKADENLSKKQTWVHL